MEGVLDDYTSCDQTTVAGRHPDSRAFQHNGYPETSTDPRFRRKTVGNDLLIPPFRVSDEVNSIFCSECSARDGTFSLLSSFRGTSLAKSYSMSF